jgi:2-keto-4-pentenoate hydratase/2-oxohepta-3-ene-1,7-dioic acid hydratase in catechol pathway
MTQQLTHHASNGCNLRPGDLCGSGTISGDVCDSLFLISFLFLSSFLLAAIDFYFFIFYLDPRQLRIDA